MNSAATDLQLCLGQAQKSFRRLMGCQQLWMLQAYLDESRADDTGEQTLDEQQKVG